MSPDRSLTKLRDNPELQKRLLKYSAAASLAVAASLALPASTGHAAPGITCVDVDPDETMVNPGTFDLDFDQDNPADPEFRLRVRTDTVDVNGFTTGDQGIDVMAPPGGTFAYALTGSVTIPAGAGFIGSANSIFLGYFNSGYWPGETDKYLGLKFTLGGNTHYGWALLDVAADSSEFTIKEYCYNTTPGEGIHAGTRGDPPTPPEPVGGYVVPVNRLELLGPWLGAAAAGLAGLTAWWRRQLSRRGE